MQAYPSQHGITSKRATKAKRVLPQFFPSQVTELASRRQRDNFYRESQHDMRTQRAIAKELGICERQMIRRLKAGEPIACAMMRGEIVEHYRNRMLNYFEILDEVAGVFRRVNPEIATAATSLADGLRKLREGTPAPEWWKSFNHRQIAARTDADWKALEAEYLEQTGEKM